MLVPPHRHVLRSAIRVVLVSALVLGLGLTPLSPPMTAGAAGTPTAPDLTGPTGTSVAATPAFTWKSIGGSATGYLVYDVATRGSTDVYQTYTPATLGCQAAGATCSAP